MTDNSGQAPQSNGLFRSRNFVDLDRESQDQDRLTRKETPNIDESIERDQLYDSSHDDHTSNEFDPNQSFYEHKAIEVSRYVNIDTQTSFSTDIFANEDDVVVEDQESTVDRRAKESIFGEFSSMEPAVHLKHQEREQKDLHKIDELEEEGEEEVDAQEQKQAKQDENLQKLSILRHLLSVERQCSQSRRQNLISMQKYLKELQNDYLHQQQELVEALELAHKIKVKKDSELEVVNETVKEKDRLIDQLKAQINSIVESKLRAEFESVQEKQHQLYELERQQLRDQITTVEQQLVRERVTNSQTMLQFQEKLADQVKLHETETNRLKERAKNFERDLERLLNEPQNLVIKTLKEEKFNCLNEIDELKMHLDESRSKYEKLRRRLEVLQQEQEQIEQSNQEEIDKLQESCNEQRRLANELALELDDKRETAEILQFNLQRSEKRARNLLNTLKGKEIAYKEIVNQLQVKNEQQADQAAKELRFLQEDLIRKSSLLDKKQNELMKIELEYENKLESMRNDRDQRIGLLEAEKQRLEKELKTTEVRLAREMSEKDNVGKLIEQLKNEANQFKQESKRLSIELTKSEAKLYSKQQELEKALGGGYEEIGSKGESNIEDDPQQVANIYELEESRRHSKRLETLIETLKKENEKLTLKLRISESNLVRLNANITREQAKMYRECEKKLNQIMADQCIYNKYKLRYKKYGNKLKKYHQHLKQVHDHFCNPTTCGPIVHDMSSQEYSTHISSRDSEGTKYTNEYSISSMH